MGDIYVVSQGNSEEVGVTQWSSHFPLTYGKMAGRDLEVLRDH